MKKYNVFINIEAAEGERNERCQVESASAAHARFDAAAKILAEVKDVISLTCLYVCEA